MGGDAGIRADLLVVMQVVMLVVLLMAMLSLLLGMVLVISGFRKNETPWAQPPGV